MSLGLEALRHRFALQYLAANRCDLPSLQVPLGHTTVATTNAYTCFAIMQSARGLNRMERFT
jgi:site-specific recombinase XerD